MLKAVIFDMDDTLVDWNARYADWHTYEREHLRRVFDYAARDLDLRCDFETFFEAQRTHADDAWAGAEDSLNAPHLGRVLAETLRALGVPPEQLDAGACLSAYEWGTMPGVVLYPGVVETLALLREAGLRLGLVTNAFAPMWARDRELALLGLPPEMLDYRVSSADVGRLKPHPAIFEHALDCLGARSNEAVFVGDSLPSDIAGAQGVGMRAILRAGREFSPLPDEPILPDAAITGLGDLPAVLDGWYPGWRNGGR